MPKAIFNQNRLPVTIDGMLDLLRQCTTENMSPLASCLLFDENEPREREKLPFDFFLDAIAYPIQSYKITPDSKLALIKEIKRLYPNLEEGGAREKLIAILKRMDPVVEIPVGLDVLLPDQELPLSERYRTSLFGGSLNPSLCGEALAAYATIGMIELVKKPLDERVTALLKECKLGPTVSDTKLAETYQAILNLLYLETVRVKNSWEWLQINRATIAASKAFYSTSASVTRISARIETATCPDWNDEEEEDFALAVQRRGLYERVVTLLTHNNKTQRRELYHIYNGLLKYAEGSENLRILHALAFLKKELTVHNLRWIAEKCIKFDNDCRQNPLLKAFVNSVKEDFFAPCNRVLLTNNKELVEGYKQAEQEYRVPQGGGGQHIADMKAVCEIYQQIATNQAELYGRVYGMLKDLVEQQKSKRAFMQYFKLVIDTPANTRVLPEQLPVIDLREYDASVEMFKEFEQPLSQEWPVIVPPTPKERPKKSKIKAPQSACAIELEATADEMVNEAVESFVAAEASVAATAVMPVQKQSQLPVISISPVPTTFKYVFRVLRWFDANVPLDKAVFPEYAEAKEAHQKLMLAYHAFSSSVDSFVIKLALEMIWNNPKTGHADTRYILPAEISIPELGKKSRGVITYCVGERGRVYHRFFSERPTEEIVRKIYDQTFRDADFPSLESSADKAILDKASSSSPGLDPDERIVRHPFWGTTTITNHRTKVQITLFPVKSDFSM